MTDVYSNRTIKLTKSTYERMKKDYRLKIALDGAYSFFYWGYFS